MRHAPVFVGYWPLLLGLCGSPLLAQRLRVGGGTGEIGTNVRGALLGYSSRGQSGSLEASEWLTLPLSGTILDARLLTWQFTFRPEWRQARYSSAPSGEEGRVLGWQGSLQLLAGSPVSLALSGSKTSGKTEGGFNVRSDNGSEFLGATLAWQQKWLPVQVSLTRQYLSTGWANLLTGTSLRNIYDVRSIRLNAANSKTSVLLERLDNDDRVGSNDFLAGNALLAHSARWGRGSSLLSTAEVTNQSGYYVYRRRQWTEQLRLQHGAGVSSSWTWRRATSANAERQATVTFLGAALDGSVGRSVQAGLFASMTTSGFARGQERLTILSSRGGFDLGRGGFRVSGSGSLGLEHRRREGTADLRVPVLREAHTVPPSRHFLLDRPDPDPSSLLVQSADQLTRYEEDTDFSVTGAGSLLQLDIPFGSRIQTGETVLVSYQYRLPGGFSDQALVADVSVLASYGGFRFRHQQSVRNSQIPDHLDAVRGRGDFNSAQTAVEFRTPSPLGHLLAEAGRTARWRPGDDHEEYTVSASLTQDRLGRGSGTAGMYWSRSRSNHYQVSTLSGQGVMAWRAMTTLFLHLGLEGMLWKEESGVTERFLGGSFDGEWQYGQTTVTFRFEHHRRASEVSSVINRISARLSRRF